MGLLDEAIREHLDLKRRHGASEEELRDKEAEALGPARREPPAAVYGEGGPVPDLAAQAPPPSPEEAVPLEPPAEHADEAVPVEPSAEAAHTELVHKSPTEDQIEPPEAEPAVDVVHGPPVDMPEEPSPLDDDLVPPEEEPPEPVERRPLPPVVEGEEPPGEPEHEESPPLPELEEEPVDEREGEALLEETPEFLQETPEHDRLWFEQKPPRNFDFDD